LSPLGDCSIIPKGEVRVVRRSGGDDGEANNDNRVTLQFDVVF
jgi:hypothetical protein